VPLNKVRFIGHKACCSVINGENLQRGNYINSISGGSRRDGDVSNIGRYCVEGCLFIESVLDLLIPNAASRFSAINNCLLGRWFHF